MKVFCIDINRLGRAGGTYRVSIAIRLEMLIYSKGHRKVAIFIGQCFPLMAFPQSSSKSVCPVS